ncbi:MAG: methionine aminopeptidase [Humibacillus sp.]
MSFWYNVDTGKVETDDTRSRGEQVLGPYASEAEARSALDTAHKKTEQWDAEDREWGSGSGAPTDANDGEPGDD